MLCESRYGKTGCEDMKLTVINAGKGRQVQVREEWGTVTWLANKELTGSDLTLGKVVIHKGMSSPSHGHPNCEEILHVLSGTIEHHVGDQKVILRPGDTLVVPPGVAHHARNMGNIDAEMIVAYPSGQRDLQLETGPSVTALGVEETGDTTTA